MGALAYATLLAPVLVVVALVMVLGGGDLGTVEVVVLAAAFLLLLLATAVAAVFAVHAFSDAGPHGDERRRWTRLLAFGGPPALVAYWRRFVRPRG